MGASLAGDVAAQTDTLLTKLAGTRTTGGIKQLEVGEHEQIGIPVLQLAQEQPLPREVRHQRFRFRILQHPPDLLLQRRRIPELSRKLGAQADDVQAAIEEIGKLDPAPGRRFAEDNNRVVVPDVTVEHDGNEWKIHLNSDYIPRLRISNTYRELIAKGTLSKAERDYLREKMRTGKFLIDSIEQRQRTIDKCPCRP